MTSLLLFPAIGLFIALGVPFVAFYAFAAFAVHKDPTIAPHLAKMHPLRYGLRGLAPKSTKPRRRRRKARDRADS